MKTKYLLQTSILIATLCVMNLFTNAQSISITPSPKSIDPKIIPTSNPQPTVVACNCSKAGYGCFAGSSYCMMACRIKCGLHRFRLANDESDPVDATSLTYVYPNPVSTSATVSCFLPQSGKVSLKIFDLNGRLVKTLADGEMEEGEHQIEWLADNINAGVYFLQFQSTEFSKMEKLIVTK